LRWVGGGDILILKGLGGAEGGSDNRTELARFTRSRASVIHPIAEPRVGPEPVKFELPPFTQAGK
jgi:hypothetical protein